MFLAHGGGGGLEFLGQVQAHVADGAEGLAGVTGAEAAVVFAKVGVEDIEPAFEQPAATQVLQQERGIGLLAGQAGDGKGRVLTDLAFLKGVAFEADQLLRAGPVEVFRFDEVGRGGDRAGFDSTAILLDRLGGLATRLFPLNCIGGKSPVGSQRLVRCRGEVWAGCLSP